MLRATENPTAGKGVGMVVQHLSLVAQDLSHGPRRCARPSRNSSIGRQPAQELSGWVRARIAHPRVTRLDTVGRLHFRRPLRNPAGAHGDYPSEGAEHKKRKH